MARTTRPVTTDHDYKVALVDLFTADGKSTGFKGTQRLDTGTIIAPVTKDYNIVQNSDIIDQARTSFDAAGLKDAEEEIRVFRDGAVMQARYTFKNRVINPTRKVGDELGLRLTLTNSFDRSRKVSFVLRLLRLVCTNGMTTLDKEYELAKKHSSQITLDFIKDGLNDAVAGFDRLAEKGNIFERMADTSLSQEQGLNILQNLVKVKAISEERREGIAQVWNNPTRSEDNDRNVYNLLNSATDYLSHQVEGERFELSQRMTDQVTRRLAAAVKTPAKMQKLLLPIKNEEVVVTA